MNREEPVVFVVDDDISVREALKNLLRSVGFNVETFGAAQEFFSHKRSSAPACLILDVRLPGLSGLDLQRQLSEGNFDLPIIFITAHGDIPMSVRAMKAGAVESLPKPFRDQDLLDAVRQAIDRDREARKNRTEMAELRERYESLTGREREVMGFVVQGLINKQIGAEIGISEPTVKLHRGRLIQKMRAESLAELIRMAQRLSVPGTS
jgi:FixJ family two-component response regulator